MSYEHRPEQVNLHYFGGGSDKVYRVQLVRNEDNPSEWHVMFQYGRRGSNLVGGDKTPNGTSYWSAKREYDKLVRSKVRKGYKGEAGKAQGFSEAYTVTRSEVAQKEKQRTNFLPQLLNPVTEEEAIQIYKNNEGNILLQTKHDGERRGVLISDKITAANRKGYAVEIQQSVADACKNLCENWDDVLEIDTEDMGSHLVIFDVLQAGGKDLRNTMFRERQQLLSTLKMSIGQQGLMHQLKVDVPYRPHTLEEFMAYIQYARDMFEEGVVIRVATEIYEPGLANQCYKLKFYADATVEVIARNAQRSVQMGVVTDRHGVVAIGNCTIPGKIEIPRVGQLIEVRYLYAYSGGSLYQPTYKGVREDKNMPDHIDSLQYKKENEGS